MELNKKIIKQITTFDGKITHMLANIINLI